MTDTHVLDGEQLTQVDDSDRPVDIDDASSVADAERFEPVGVLGKGGMGEVRLMRDRRISRFVAYKVLRAGVEKDPQYRARFLLEARVQGQLEHPAIVPVHDLGETAGGELYFSMKRVRGETLREALDAIARPSSVAKYSRRRLLTAFSSVCLAVDFAHARGVVHRDLKPENVMLGAFGEVYVLDWGIAKVMHRADTPLAEAIDVPDVSAATRAGATLGTPKYMSPERHMGVANPQTDVYALGVILGEILAAHGDIPPELEMIHLDATALDAGSRYRNARALHDALEQYLDGDRDLATRTRVSEDHARRAEAALARSHADPGARTIAGQEIGRALGLDPQNRLALRTLMRMLTDVPDNLPPAAKVEMDRRWGERRRTTQRRTTISTAAVLGMMPFLLWMGVRDWMLFFAFIVLVGAAAFTQFAFAGRRFSLPIALCLLLAGLTVLTTSLGLLGVVPAAFSTIALAWRMNVERTSHGLMILGTFAIFLVAPFVLVGLGAMSPTYEIRDDVLMILPNMHSFPPVPTLVTILFTTLGSVGFGLIYGRLYINELRRVEHRLSFQAWQLQQLVPPER